jgi:hypothetical protein
MLLDFNDSDLRSHTSGRFHGFAPLLSVDPLEVIVVAGMVRDDDLNVDDETDEAFVMDWTVDDTDSNDSDTRNLLLSVLLLTK